MANQSSGKALMLQGRIVWTCGADPFKAQLLIDFNTKAPKLNKQGEQARQYGFGLAVPKNLVVEMWQVMHEQAFEVYPTRQLPPAFSMKFKDGDVGVDQNGQSYALRAGYPGCLVFALTTSLPIQFFRREGGNNVMINEGIKCGDYVQVQTTVVAHGPEGQGKPGLYLNPNAVLFLGYGEEIVNRPSGDQIFGNTPVTLPPGASATPLAPSGMLVPPPQQFQQPMLPGMSQQPQAHYAVLPPQHQPPGYAPNTAPAPIAQAQNMQPQQFQQPMPMPAFGPAGMPTAQPAGNNMPMSGQPQGMPVFPGVPR